MKKYSIYILVLLIVLSVLFIYQEIKFNDGKLHIVFCDVGQGDGILITTPSKKQILIDGGPDKSISDCLSRNMPFWDNKIDLAILTHPHQDHFSGLYFALERYEFKGFVTENVANTSESYRDLIARIDEQKIPRKFVARGDKFKMSDGVIIDIKGPDASFLKLNCIDGMISDCTNQVTLITSLKYKNFDVLFTGDNETEGLLDVLSEFEKDIEVMQVPHHGSASGLDSKILDGIDPELAIISVGAKNRFGHPKEFILELLEEKRIRVLRTDEHGDIQIVSDGEGWRVE